MSAFKLIKQGTSNYGIEGDLTFTSINKKSIPSFIFLQKTKETFIDLKNVSSTDSAGLAFILELIKHSHQYKTKLIFKNIPHQLLTLATLSNLDLSKYVADAA